MPFLLGAMIAYYPTQKESITMLQLVNSSLHVSHVTWKKAEGPGLTIG